MFDEAVIWLAGVEDLENGIFLRVYTKENGSFDVTSVGNHHIVITDDDWDEHDLGYIHNNKEFVQALEDFFAEMEIEEITVGGAF